MKLLFIAYYFEPYDGVGAKRISYWAKYIKKLCDKVQICDVITATKQKNRFMNIDNVYFVENNQKSVFKYIFKVK